MKHFVDVLQNRKYNLSQEVLALEKLFLSSNVGSSIHKVFSAHFLSWKLRNNYIDFDTFFEGVGLAPIVDKCHSRINISIDEFIFYCEYMLNVIACDFIWSHTNAKYICDNIVNLLEKLNYVVHDSDDVYHIVEKNVLVSEAADVVGTNYELGESVYSFNYRETKGDFNKKADILCRLYKYVESISLQAKKYGYTAMLDDITALLNKLDIRHSPTKKQESVIGEMTVDEYESWLDELFRMILSLIILVDYSTKRKDIKELKSKLG